MYRGDQAIILFKIPNIQVQGLTVRSNEGEFCMYQVILNYKSNTSDHCTKIQIPKEEYQKFEQ